ncbi:ATP-binding protein [Jiulongibacter sp. NS-SX5]|uniref:ATP-binding protein n=1 Tax=Jiulongibacter sp. NS-SX5 TaxID=3463854 RepID=UPI00405908B4
MKLLASKLILILCLYFISKPLSAQLNTENLDQWIEEAPFFDIQKRDSILTWADQLKKIENSPRAHAYSFRLMGLHEEFDEKMPDAIGFYLKFLELSRSSGQVSDEMSATGDIVYIYITTKQYEKAKKLLLNFTQRPDKERLNQKKLSVFYNNLGICYNNLNQPDSAVLMYGKALKIKEAINDQKGMADLRINMSSQLMKQQKFSEAYELTMSNIEYLNSIKNDQDLWYNLINMGGILNGLGKYKEAESYLKKALDSAYSKSRKQEALENLSNYYSGIGKYEQAYTTLVQSERLNSEIINESTNEKIAELTEAYKAKQRDLENSLLSSELKSAQNRQFAFILGLILSFALIGVLLWFYLKNQQKNKLIASQNEGLLKLNKEKNELMAVVSHDLSSPFTAIKIWSESMRSKPEAEVLANKIRQAAVGGLHTIGKMLTIDKNEIFDLEMVQIDLAELLKELNQSFEPIATKKGIELDFTIVQDRESILSDKEMLSRALSNLLSNAIKFSHPNSIVNIRTDENDGHLEFEFKDRGVGIPESEQENLFKMYSMTSVKPTSNETSNGLGLFIAKRIGQELGGSLDFVSKPNEGSVFTLSIPVL